MELALLEEDPVLAFPPLLVEEPKLQDFAQAQPTFNVALLEEALLHLLLLATLLLKLAPSLECQWLAKLDCTGHLEDNLPLDLDPPFAMWMLADLQDNQIGRAHV